jgi:signal peptidase II
LYLLAALVVVADQWTKHWVAQAHWAWPDDTRPVVPGFFSLSYTENTGGAFSIFEDARFGTLALAFVSLAAAAAIIVYTLRARPPLPSVLGTALGLALGGAVGNMIDRVRLHHVVDFLLLYVGTHEWPVFNIADSAICVGVALLGVHYAGTPAQTRPVSREGG